MGWFEPITLRGFAVGRPHDRGGPGLGRQEQLELFRLPHAASDPGRALGDPTLREAAKNGPNASHRDGRAENLLFYEDPDFGFAVNATVVNERGMSGHSLGRIHDHAHIYTLYGILDGRERIERYERVDDRSRPDYAEIRRLDDSLCGPGDIDFVRPTRSTAR